MAQMMNEIRHVKGKGEADSNEVKSQLAGLESKIAGYADLAASLDGELAKNKLSTENILTEKKHLEDEHIRDHDN